MKRQALAVAILLLPSCMAQQVPSHQVYIRNSESVPVSFGLSCDDRKSWRVSELKATDGQRFACDASSAKMWVHINSDVPNSPHRECEIRLEDEKRYELFFDKDQNKWDLRQM